MQKQSLLKRIVAILMLIAVVTAVVPTAFAQDDADTDTTTETTDDHGGEEEVAEEGGLLTPLGINSGLLFVQTFNFLLMAVILSMIMWRPMVNFLDARSARIQKGLEDAAAAAQARQNAEAEADKIRAEARADVAKLLEEARSRGDELAKQLESTARDEADKIKADASADAESARDAELAGLRDQVLSISVAVAGKILGENLDAKKQQALVDDFFTKLPADAKSLSGTLEVVSAMPLSDAEQGKVKSELGSDDVNFSVDPAILGGLIVRSSDRVVDGSVKSGLDDVAGQLS